jgi:hypothetical protein
MHGVPRRKVTKVIKMILFRLCIGCVLLELSATSSEKLKTSRTSTENENLIIGADGAYKVENGIGFYEGPWLEDHIGEARLDRR